MVDFNDATKQFWQWLVGRNAGAVSVKDEVQLRTLMEIDNIAGDIIWPGTVLGATNPLGWNVARFISKLQAGTNVKVTVLGDSVYQGSTAGAPGVNDAVSLLCSTLASRFGVSVTKSNLALGGRTAIWERLDRWTQALTDNADLYILGLTGKNDSPWDYGGTSSRLAGYERKASLAQIESMIRELRCVRPNADILIWSGNPYGSASVAANAYQKAYSAGLAKLAGAYDCAYADGWNAIPRADGFPDAADAAYLTDGVHPNTAGHRKLFEAADPLFPASLDMTKVPAYAQVTAATPLGVIYPQGHCTKGTPVLSVGSTTALTDRIINPSFMSAGWTGTGPWTSSTVGGYTYFEAKCSEVFLQFTYGVGQGKVDIEVDGVIYASAVDLNTAGWTGGQWLAVSGLTPGVHHIRIVVNTGTVTLVAIAYTAAVGEWIDIRSPRVGFTAMGVASDTNEYYGMHSNAVALGSVITVDFIGTGISIEMFRSLGSRGGGVSYWSACTIDGVAYVPQVTAGWGGAGNFVVASGLSYGKHTLSMTWQATGVQVGGFTAIDERPETHPYSCEGIAKVGDTVLFSYPWTDTPTVTVTSTTANPANAVSVSSTSFTITGTAGDTVKWSAVCSQRGVY